MSENCFDIGTIQAFLDGEASPEISTRLTDHAAECDVCALALADAEEENSLVFATLDRELDALVPTQRLWSRINESIEVEKSRMSVWQRLAAFVSTSLISPSFATAAGVLLIAGIFAVVWNNRSTPVSQPGPVVAGGTQTAPSTSDSTGTVTIAVNPSDPIPSPAASNRTFDPYITVSHVPAEKIGKMVTNANYNPNRSPIRPQYAIATGYLPGEESYVKTIADLKQNVDTKKDTVLSPSSRVSYERDMAVVDDSIKKMRAAVKSNPRNQAAKQVLYSSYQDKIDLLNSVAQRGELMASMQ
jgi:hypothetical protein